jgi:hypothetical protein
MPRGQRKRGQFEVRVWFEDGMKYECASSGKKDFTNAEMAAYIRKNVLSLLEPVTSSPAVDAVGLSVEAVTDGERA